MGERIFIVEDDLHLKEKLKQVLMKWGYEVASVQSFDQVDQEVKAFGSDLILMDINLPRYDGYHWCRILRQDLETPIIFISSKDMDMDIVMAMEMGGDDYLIKPFSSEVLLAKIKAILRRLKRTQNHEPRNLNYKGLSLEEAQSAAVYEQESAQLTRNEWRILHELVSKSERIISRNRLMEVLWDDDQFVNENTLTVNVNRLRQKLEGIGFKDSILTKKGQGYQLFKEEGDDDA